MGLPGDPLTTLWGQLRHLFPFGPTGGLSAVLGARLLAAHGAELGSSCSLFLGSQKNCSFRGSSFTSTGMASYSSLSMLKEPPVPCEEESVQLTPHLAESRQRQSKSFILGGFSLLFF